MIVSDAHSNLLLNTINFGREKFYSTGPLTLSYPGPQFYKTFIVVICGIDYRLY
jgi:hypothetical protein